MNNQLIPNEDFQIEVTGENGIFTARSLDPGSSSNNQLLEDFQEIDNLPIIPITNSSCFDLNNLPQTETLQELLTNLCEVMIRFDSSPKYYQKGDYEQLIKTLTNSLIYLYLNRGDYSSLEEIVNQLIIDITNLNETDPIFTEWLNTTPPAYPSDIPTIDQDTVIDANYVHTDNNLTNELKGSIESALQTETDPTVPSWAKTPSKPTYTASEVGAEPELGFTPEQAGVAQGLITQVIDGATDNTLKKLQDKITALNAIVGGSAPDGDNIINTVAELLAVFNAFPEGASMVDLLTAKVNVSDVYNALDCIIAGKILDARQGKVLSDAISALSMAVAGKQINLGFTPENVSNKVTSVSINSTDVQYPTAKLFYDTVGNLETILASI